MGRGLKGALVVLLGVLSALSAAGSPRGEAGAVSVLSGGAAQSCFFAARFRGPSLQDEATCSDALDSGSLVADDRAATFVNRGVVRERLAKFKDALDDYDAGLAIRPNLADAFVDRGAVLIKLGRYADAIADLSKGIALGSERAEIAFYDRGQARELLGEFDDACADYRQALVLQPTFDAAKQRTDVCNLHPKRKPG